MLWVRGCYYCLMEQQIICSTKQQLLLSQALEGKTLMETLWLAWEGARKSFVNIILIFMASAEKSVN